MENTVNTPPISETNYKVRNASKEIVKDIIKNGHRLFKLYISRAQQLLVFQRYEYS